MKGKKWILTLVRLQKKCLICTCESTLRHTKQVQQWRVHMPMGVFLFLAYVDTFTNPTDLPVLVEFMNNQLQISGQLNRRYVSLHCDAFLPCSSFSSRNRHVLPQEKLKQQLAQSCVGNTCRWRNAGQGDAGVASHRNSQISNPLQ